MLAGIKKNVFKIIEPSVNGNSYFRIFNIFIMTLIILNVIAVMLETVESASLRYYSFFKYFEYVSVIIFTIEYILRLWTCTENIQYNKPVSGRFRYALIPFTLIDLLAIAPFYLPMVISIDMRFIRILRLFRISRMFKLGRYSKSLLLIGKVFKEKKEELVITFIFGFILLIVSSSIMYYCEHEVQPEVFSSIPSTMWWGVATLTTVGYGDAYPITHIGKFFGAITAIVGIGLFALPAGILGSGFVKMIEKNK